MSFLRILTELASPSKAAEIPGEVNVLLEIWFSQGVITMVLQEVKTNPATWNPTRNIEPKDHGFMV